MRSLDLVRQRLPDVVQQRGAPGLLDVQTELRAIAPAMNAHSIECMRTFCA
jgi:hypothetical protein